MYVLIAGSVCVYVFVLFIGLCVRLRGTVVCCTSGYLCVCLPACLSIDFSVFMHVCVSTFVLCRIELC